MDITKAELIALEACNDGLARFIKQTGNTDEPVAITSLIGGVNTQGDLLWLAGKILPKEKIVKFACQCALINIEMIKPYTNLYDEIVAFLKNPTPDAAADAAYAAADAAYAAADVAADAADVAADAARAAADAARAAAYAAAADVAAYAAARAAENKINEFLVELFS